jgi:hypothetical protein
MFPNKYPGNCINCGARILAAGGLTYKTEDGWKVLHQGDCPTTNPDSPVQAAKMDYTPTPEQAECLRLFATGKDLVIQAGAGAGKTTTLLQFAQWAAERGLIGQYTAYNKDIVKDVKTKAPGNVSVSTMHALAYAVIGYLFKERLDNNTRQRASETAAILGLSSWDCQVDGRKKVLPAGFLAGLVMKAIENFCRTIDTEPAAKHFRLVEGLDLPNEDGTSTNANNKALAAHLVPFAKKAWADLTDPKGALRYSPDCYLKQWSMSSPRIKVDFIMLDEAQDADPVQVSIIEQQRQYGTQIVVVGDSMQVLYEWRGAIDALADFEKMGANVAYLTQSFRFGDAVADVANDLLSRLDAKLRIKGFGPVASTVGPIDEPDAILCRTNAGAVKALVGELAAGRKAHLVGGGAKVIAFCEAALNLQLGRPCYHPELSIFANWAEVERYITEDEQGEDLKLMVKLVNDFGAEAIIEALENAAAKEDQADVVISTAHKSKGRQWGNVQIAGDFKAPKEDMPMSASELRLAYVSATRARFGLDLTMVPHFLGEGS